MSVEIGGDVAGESAAASPSSSSVELPPPQAGEARSTDETEPRALHSRAQRAFELAKHALSSRDPSDHSDGPALAIQLFRQSIYWSLRARGGELEESEAQLLLARHAADLRARLGSRSEELIELLATFDFTSLAQQPAERLLATAADLERLASQLLVEGQRAIWAEQRPQTLAVSLAFAAMGCVLFALTAVAMGMLSKPNLAEGKPWTASSVFAVCDPVAKRCGGVATAVFFHTNEEESPWVEYDLGAPVQFSSVTVLNRSDAVQERAVPLVLEVSNDKKTYKELARRKEVFDVWEPSFVPQRARYVRLRIARRSMLHLDGVQVHP